MASRPISWRDRWSVWRTLGFRFVLRAKLGQWFLMGGQIERHPHHHTIWTAVLGLFAAVWGGLVFATTSGVAHGFGWASLGLAAYIGAAFFLPFPLPPIRDEQKVAARRADYERRRRAALAAMNAALRPHDDNKQ